MWKVVASLALEAIGIWSQKILCMQWLIFICKPAWAGPILMGQLFSDTNLESWRRKKRKYLQWSPDKGETQLLGLYTASQEAGWGWGRVTRASTCPGAGPLAETVSGAGPSAQAFHAHEGMQQVKDLWEMQGHTTGPDLPKWMKGNLPQNNVIRVDT